MRNLIDEEAHHHTKQHLNAILQGWLDQTGDIFLSSEEFSRHYVDGKMINSHDEKELKKEIR